MKYFIQTWIISTIVFYISASLFFLTYDAEIEPISGTHFALSNEGVLLMLLSGAGILFSSIVYHPQNKKFLDINKGFFLIQVLGKYLFFVSSFMFVMFYDLKVFMIFFCCIMVFIEAMFMFLILKKIRLKGGNNLLISSKNLEKNIFSKTMKEKKIRTIIQLVTIPSFVIFVVLIERANEIEIKLSVMYAIMFYGLPLLWGIGEMIDYILKKRSKKISEKNKDIF
ncbi:MAG: hypothetical protein LBU60_00625 [Clostridiales bacterium]|jgi:hypothetical protein|nr:hypothetical protein [Clostridiales bacterium]